MKLVSVCRGKSIVFSQDAHDWEVRRQCSVCYCGNASLTDCCHAQEVRGPRDVMNLAVMCGMTLEQATHAVGEWPRQCIMRGVTRASTYRAAVAVAPDPGPSALIDDAADLPAPDAERDAKRAKKQLKKKHKKGKKQKHKKERGGDE